NGATDDGNVGAGGSCAVPGKLGPCAAGTLVCSGAAGLTCSQTVFPAAENCNGVDDDCDGTTDDFPDGGALTQNCYTGPGGTQNVGICRGGTQTCSAGTFGACTGQTLPAAEVCNGV